MLCAVDACTAVPVDLFWVSRDTPRVTVASISAVTTTTLQKEGQTVMYKAGNLNLAVDTTTVDEKTQLEQPDKTYRDLPSACTESVRRFIATVDEKTQLEQPDKTYRDLPSACTESLCNYSPFTASVRFVRLYINFKMSYQRMDEQIVRENTEQRLTVRFGTALVPLSAV
ncbi:hypothetical protein M514_12757 [Trichuris suis]|uniref:Uncharacterized protein n=1 Tax=Trichuris suis TaxID=68888 RepID=A0A085N6D4_9BILA|nr:hypothetical protein M514_12757 [Trichuris suis]